MSHLHTEEVRLFGGAAEQGGQGRFLLRVSHPKLTNTLKDAVHPGFRNVDAARYLGYGVMVAFKTTNKETGVSRQAGQLDRDCINENQTFTVQLLFREVIQDTVREALIAFGLLGGLGSRVRHGMGSVALVSIREDGAETWTAPTSEADYIARVRALFVSIPLPAGEPPFTAFWVNSRIECQLTAPDCYGVLDSFGKAMLMYRSWGRGGTVLGIPSEKRFVDDHDWYRKPAGSYLPAKFHPRRVVFGLPHDYHKNEAHHVTPATHERRASPLLFHVHPAGHDFIGVGIYLPAQFLPDGEQISAGGVKVPACIEWPVITDFLDGLTGPPASPGATARFPGKTRVLP